MSLAAKLPYSHPYANGFGYGGTNVPTDTDGLDYLSRMATADGAGLETGIAGAIDRFIKACKADNIWDSIRSSCILAGARSLNGALVPIKNEGPELWDNPSIVSIADSGTDGAYDSATQTLTNTTGSAAAHPRFRFALTEDLRQGAEYIIEGRFSGDISAVYGVRPRNADAVVFVDAETGEFSGTAEQTAASTQLEILLNAAVQSNISVTIESISIREVIDDPINSPVGNGFVEGDYTRGGATPGLTGDGTSYIDSGRANDADPQDSKHIAFYAADDAASGVGYMGSLIRSPTVVPTQLYSGTGVVRGYVNNGVETTRSYSGGFAGTQRLDDSTVETRADGVTLQASTTSSGGNSYNTFVFCRNDDGTPGAFANSTIAFYSIGTDIGSAGLTSLDTAVTNLMADITFFFNTGLNPADYDTETVRYVNAGYAAGGTLE